MIYYIDIDGVLTNEIEGHNYKNRTPHFGNIKKVNRLCSEGNIVILYTSRYYRDFFVTRKWLKAYKVKYHKTRFRKPKYDVFIDDKAQNNFRGIND